VGALGRGSIEKVVLDDSDVVLRARLIARDSSGSSGSLNGFWLPRTDAGRGLAFSLVDVDRSGTVCICGFEYGAEVVGT